MLIIQGFWSEGRIATEFETEVSQTVAMRQAKRLLVSPYFEGDSVRVITGDGELVWFGTNVKFTVVTSRSGKRRRSAAA